MCLTVRLPRKITVCASIDLPNLSSANVDFLISIADPDEVEPPLESFENAQTLKLRFHDITEPFYNLSAPRYSHIAALLDFGRSLGLSEGNHLVIHCNAGICRSPAALLLLMAQAARDRSPEEVMAQMLKVAPNAWPNILMVQLGDQLLDYNNRLVSAVTDYFETVYERYPDFARLMGRL